MVSTNSKEEPVKLVARDASQGDFLCANPKIEVVGSGAAKSRNSRSFTANNASSTGVQHGEGTIDKGENCGEFSVPFPQSSA